MEILITFELIQCNLFVEFIEGTEFFKHSIYSFHSFPFSSILIST
jgi:hypothetical protein